MTALSHSQSDRALTPQWLLVMTATIQPASQADVRRSDPALRLADYQRALRFWLAEADPVAARILFLENSSADLSSLQSIAAEENPLGKSVEFHSIPASPIPHGLNYGFSEMELLDAGLERSALRAETTHMVKTTGRLIFPSLGRAIRMLPTAPELLIDCRRFPWPRRGADARVQIFACSHGFYGQHLRGAQQRMRPDHLRLLEQLLYDCVIAQQGEPGVFLRFPCNVDPVGYSGFKGSSYQTAGQRIDQSLRALLRQIAPSFWY